MLSKIVTGNVVDMVDDQGRSWTYSDRVQDLLDRYSLVSKELKRCKSVMAVMEERIELLKWRQEHPHKHEEPGAE